MDHRPALTGVSAETRRPGQYDPADMRNSDPAGSPATSRRTTQAVRRLADLAAIGDILPHGGFGARYHEQAMPTWT